MIGYIDGYNFKEMEAMKYFAPKAGDPKAPQEAKNRIFSSEWMGSRKYDGYFAKFVKDEDGNMFLLSRSRGVDGSFGEKIDKVPQLIPFFENLPNGCCFLGELYIPGREGSNEVTKLLGSLTPKAIARQTKEEDKIHFYIFDVLAYNNISFMKKPAKERFEFVTNSDNVVYVEFAHYETGEKLWNTLQDVLASGGEGIVITHQDALYSPGSRSKKVTLKVKRELSETIDCYFTGRAAAPKREYSGGYIETWEYWIDSHTDERLPVGSHYYEAFMEGKPYMAVTKPYYYHWAGSLEIAVRNGELDYSLGYIGGLPDEIKANYKDHIHDVVEVGAMQWADESCTRLRHGRIVSYRDDKDWIECTIEQIK